MNDKKVKLDRKYEGVNYEVIKQAIPEMVKHYKSNLAESFEGVEKYGCSFLEKYTSNEEEFEKAWNLMFIGFREFLKDNYSPLLKVIENLEPEKFLGYKETFSNFTEDLVYRNEIFVKNLENEVRNKNRD